MIAQPYRFWITTATPTREINDDRQFENITQVWLGATIINGASCVPAAWTSASLHTRFRTRRNFSNEVLGKAIGNPLFHWSHLSCRNISVTVLH